MSRIRRVTTTRGFTLMEVLAAVVIVALLAGLAIPFYLRSAERARSTEAISNLGSIREGEYLYRAAHGAFVEALDLPTVNTALDVELSARHFDYEVKTADASTFLIVATSRLPAVGSSLPYQITMDEAGQLSFLRSGSSGGGGGGVGGGGAGGGGGLGGGGGSGGGSGGGGGSLSGSDGSGSSGSGGGDSTSGAGGDSSGGSSGGGGSDSGGGSDGGGSDDGNTGGGGGGPPPPREFTYIPRGADEYSNWSDSNTKNITGTSGQITTLTSVFNTVAGSGAKAITDDLFAKGIEISFGSPADFAPGGICAGSIACHVSLTPNPPNTPSILPEIFFNPDYATEATGVLAGVLVHEGTHFQQFLDGTIRQFANNAISVVDVEFTAWWNAAVYWDGVRSSFLPIDTDVELTLDIGWEKAKEGEGALRDFIASVYGG